MPGVRWVSIGCLSVLAVLLGARGGWESGVGLARAAQAPGGTDAVALLQEKIDNGEVRLEYSDTRGYLDSLLEALDIPVASQTLVFSKTSLQSPLITPQEPRALYFNDDVYVGFVRRGPLVELGVVDPERGTIFYTLSQEEAERPVFEAEGIRCISCHLPSPNIPVPRLMVMSVLPNETGQPVGTDVSLVTDASSMARRWGGWYVTGTGGHGIHRGNSLIGSSEPRWAIGESSHLEDLESLFDTTPYPRNDSDIVALLLLVHQSEIHNLMGDAGYAVRAAIEEEERRERFLTDPDPAFGEATLSRVRELTEPLVRGLFFADAAPLEGIVASPSGFAGEFASRGPRDSRGRSLRDLDLGERVFRYPLSYLIYSAQFDALPEPARAHVYRRIGEILDGEDTTGDFDHLSEADRTAIREILLETRPEFREMAGD